MPGQAACIASDAALAAPCVRQAGLACEVAPRHGRLSAAEPVASQEDPMTVHAGAEVADDVVLGDGTTVWPLAQIREGAKLGAGCIVGRGDYIGPGVVMGDNCKLQNLSLIHISE